MKYLFSFIISFLLIPSVSANIDFIQILESKGIDTQSLLEAKSVSRNRVTELLNIVDCQDCHRPTKDMVTSLTASWWNMFLRYPGNNFDDVQYDSSISEKNNYYCISYVGNKGYMNGFPRSTSPVCSGKFCGDMNITNADMIQTIFNITSKLFYNQYKVDRSKISTRLSSQPSEVQRYFGLEDIANIEVGKRQCVSGTCSLQNIGALKTYNKYCTYDPLACGMQEFAFTKKGKRPIAEMNILVQQGIFTLDDMNNFNIEDFAKGSFIIDLLGRVKDRAQCIDNDDQDSDGIKDYDDNCYLTFNPKQRDTDQDKIGDVCDDDIDNDTVKNPIGIVDDEGNIVYDSILYNQSSLSEVIGLAIQQSLKKGNEYDFTAKYVGKLKDFRWNFGDGKSGQGIDISHLYTAPGTYIVRLTAKDAGGKSIEAVSTIVIKPATNTGGVRASLVPTKLTQNVGEKVSYNIIIDGITYDDIDYVKLSRGDGRTKELRGKDIANFIDSYSRDGKYLIEGTIYLKDSSKLPLAAFITVLPRDIVTKDVMDNCLFIVNTNQLDEDGNKVGNACDNNERVGLSITPKQITQNYFIFTSQYSGSLKNFTWFFGDRTTGSGETGSHTYRSNGQYTVRLEATTIKGNIISATTTIVVGGPRVALLPSKLVQTVGEKVAYTIQLQNIQTSDIDYVSVQRGDGRERQLRGKEITAFIDTYNTFGGFSIGGTVYLNNNTTLALGSYVTVVGQYFCLGNVNGSRNNACDMDKDSIPDMCDTDIDGDGVQNPLGLILFEKKGCVYDAINTHITPKIGSGTTPGDYDNCPFKSNPDQGPCPGLDLDTDGDGILDIYDVCPTIPELFNGVQDTDGCPEYDFIVSFPPTKLQPGSCNVCPCQFAQNDSALVGGDRVKAVLYNTSTQKPVAESNWYLVP